LSELGFIGSLVDISLLTSHHDNIHIFFLIDVDDMVVTRMRSDMIFSLIQSLQQELLLKDLGNQGIQAPCTPKGLHLSQTKYIVDLLHHVRMMGAREFSSPCVLGSKLCKLDGDPSSDASKHRHVVGALRYCTLTRPKLSLCQPVISTYALPNYSSLESGIMSPKIP
jgi:hypothetical protein